MKRPAFVFLASLLILFSRYVVSQDTGQTKQADKVATDSAKGAQPTVAPKVEIKAAPTGNNTSKDKQQTPQPEPKPFMSHAEWVIATLTLIYVIATMGYVVISFHMLSAIKKQAGIAALAADVAQKTLMAIERQGNLMERQTKATEDAATERVNDFETPPERI
jgi:hypothetical protein